MARAALALALAAAALAIVGGVYASDADCTANALSSPVTGADLRAALGAGSSTGGVVCGGETAADCDELASHLNTALDEFGMKCPLRLGALLGQARIESNSLDPTYLAAGGVLGLPTSVLRDACRAVTGLDTAAAGAFPGCGTVGSDPCACGTAGEIGTLLGMPEHVWRVAGWYFLAGSVGLHNDVNAEPCGDLRQYADDGIGVWPGWVSTGAPGSGFYRVSTCVNGVVFDGNRDKRTKFSSHAVQHWDATFPAECNDGVHTPAPNTGAHVADTFLYDSGVDCGGVCLAGCPTGAVCHSHDECAATLECDHETNQAGVCVDPHAACAANALASFTANDLKGLMGGDCFDCQTHFDILQPLLAEYRFECPLRLAALAAQMRHETNGFRSFYVPEGNKGGALHLSPEHLRDACRANTAVREQFEAHFTDNDIVHSPCGASPGNDAMCDCGSDEEVGLIAAQPAVAFTTALWWFVEGAADAYGTPCSDLRYAADEGIGRWEGWVSSAFPGEGFHRTSTCIYGFSADEGREQRVRHYTTARLYYDPTYVDPCQNGIQDAGEPDVDCGARCFRAKLCPDGAGCGTGDDCASQVCEDITSVCKDRSATCRANSVVSGEEEFGAADFTALMGGVANCGADGSACDDLWEYFWASADAYGLTCPVRLAGYVAHVRLGSNDLTDFSGGGAIKLPRRTDTNELGVRTACRRIPALKAAFKTTFAESCFQVNTNPCSCGNKAQAEAVAAAPEFAFETAAWYLSGGSGELVNRWACNDARIDFDVGIGVSGEPPSADDPGTGFYRTIACANGMTAANVVTAPPLYTTARKVYDPQFVQPSSCANGVKDGDESDVDCGGACRSGCAVDKFCRIESDCDGDLRCWEAPQGSPESGVCSDPREPCDGASAPTLDANGVATLLGNANPSACAAGACADLADDAAAAMANYDLTCPLRASAFLSLVGGITNDLTVLQGGNREAPTASALLLPVADLRAACKAVPALASAAAAAFPSCAGACACGTAEQFAALAAAPETAFEVAAWWFSGGGSCGDLRTAADVGTPTPGYGFSVGGQTGLDGTDALLQAAPGNGIFYAMACASGWVAPTTAVTPAALARYERARNHAVGGGFTLAASCADGQQNGDETDVDCGGSSTTCYTRCAAGRGCSADSDCEGASECLSGVCSNTDADCAANAVTLTENQLVTIMGGSCTNCASHLPFIQAALDANAMTCPLRYADFLAAVRHETGGLTTFINPTDNGAGALHVIPQNFRRACREVPDIKAAFVAEFTSCTYTDKCLCGTDAQAANVIAVKEVAYKIAAWWYARGSAELMGRPCGDLRKEADVGLGVAGTVSRTNPGSGYHKIAACTFGFQVDYGGAQRLAYYGEARNAFDAAFSLSANCVTDCKPGSVETTPCDPASNTDRVCTKCKDLPGGESDPACACPAGFEGADCSTNVDDCAANDPCLNGGTCVDGVDSVTCNCPATHIGDNCEQAVADCTGDCSACGAGEYQVSACGCNTDRVCATCTTCAAGEWEARACANGKDAVCKPIQTCGSGTYERAAPTSTSDRECVPCTVCDTNGGEMIVSACMPDSDRVCEACEVCPDDYETVYMCTATADAVCACLDTDDRNCVDDCENAAELCLNGAECVDGINEHTCDCADGFSGDRCHHNIDECLPEPCQNGAPCVDGIAEYTCDCWDGFTGTDCEALEAGFAFEITHTDGESNPTATEGGADATISFVLTAQPMDGVNITLAANAQVDLSAELLMFGPSNWNVAQDVSVAAVVDYTDEAETMDVTITATSVSDQPIFDGEVNTQDVTVVDTDEAGVSIDHEAVTVEEGEDAVVEISLDTKPTALVTFSAGDVDGEGTAGTSLPADFTFDPSEWASDFTIEVSITADDDDIDSGNVSNDVAVEFTASSADPFYDGLTVQVTITITENDQAGVVAAPSPIELVEDGPGVPYELVLTSEPVADVVVTVDLAEHNADEDLHVTPTSVTFTSSNWDTPQEVTVSGVADNRNEPDVQRFMIAHTVASDDPVYGAAGFVAGEIEVDVTDVDEAHVTVGWLNAEGGVVEEGSDAAATLAIRLTSHPYEEVTVNLVSAGYIQLDPAELLFEPTDWSSFQHVAVTANDDDIDQGEGRTETISVSATSDDDHYEQPDAASIDVDITDNDDAAIILNLHDASGDWGEGHATTRTLEVSLATRPTAAVTVTINAGTDLTSNPVQMLFGANSNPGDIRTATIAVVDDRIDEGDVDTVTIHTSAVSDDEHYDGATADLDVDVPDNDDAGVDISFENDNAEVLEGSGGPATMRVALTSTPTHSLTLDITGDARLHFAPTQLHFSGANWDTPQDVVITAVDNNVVEDDTPASVFIASTSDDANYDVAVIGSTSVTVVEDDVASVTASVASLSLEEDGEAAQTNVATYQLVLTSQPTQRVIVSVLADTLQVEVEPSTVVFEVAAWNVPIDVRIMAISDGADNEAPSHTVHVSHSVTSADPHYNGASVPADTVTVTIFDQAQDDCVGHACQNGATCVDEIAGYHCVCAVGYTGAMCGTSVEPIGGQAGQEQGPNLNLDGDTGGSTSLGMMALYLFVALAAVGLIFVGVKKYRQTKDQTYSKVTNVTAADTVGEDRDSVSSGGGSAGNPEGASSRPGSAARSRPTSAARSRPGSAGQSRPGSAQTGPRPTSASTLRKVVPSFASRPDMDIPDDGGYEMGPLGSVPATPRDEDMVGAEPVTDLADLDDAPADDIRGATTTTGGAGLPRSATAAPGAGFKLPAPPAAGTLRATASVPKGAW